MGVYIGAEDVPQWGPVPGPCVEVPRKTQRDAAVRNLWVPRCLGSRRRRDGVPSVAELCDEVCLFVAFLVLRERCGEMSLAGFFVLRAPHLPGPLCQKSSALQPDVSTALITGDFVGL